MFLFLVFSVPLLVPQLVGALPVGLELEIDKARAGDEAEQAEDGKEADLT